MTKTEGIINKPAQINSSNQLDPRFVRSRKSMQQALVRLINQKDYPSISVSEICTLSNVSRPTFYLHYTSKDELLLDCFEEMCSQVYRRLNNLRKNESRDVWRKSANILLFKEFQRAQKLVAGVLTVNSSSIFNVVASLNRPLFLEYLTVNGKHMPANILERHVMFYCGGFTGLLQHWFDVSTNSSQLTTAEEMGYFSYLTTTNYLKGVLLNDATISNL